MMASLHSDVPESQDSEPAGTPLGPGTGRLKWNPANINAVSYTCAFHFTHVKMPAVKSAHCTFLHCRVIAHLLQENNRDHSGFKM